MSHKTFSSGSNDRPFAIAAFVCLGWFAVAGLDLLLKQRHAIERSLTLLLRTSGLGERATLGDYLFLFQQDLFLYFIVLPLVIGGALRFLPARRLQIGAFLTASLVVLMLLYANLHSWHRVGRFLTYTALIDAVAFGWHHPSFIDLYVDSESRMKLFGLIAVVSLLHLAATRLARFRMLAWCAIACVSVAFASALGAVVIAQTSTLKTSPAARSFTVAAVDALVRFGSTDGNVYLSRNKDELVHEFQHVMRTLPASELRSTFGVAKDHDLLVFVLETGASRFADLKNDLDAFPTLERLSHNSLILLNHHSTFPASSEANFSIHAGMYPMRTMYESCVVSGSVKLPHPIPGFISGLTTRGYDTTLYEPYRNNCCPLDDVLHRNYGYKQVFVAQTDAAKNGVEGVSRNPDLQALEKLKRDVAEHIKSGTRYAAMYLPQGGHGPWPDRAPSTPIAEHGRLLIKLQDRWLGQVVDMLQRAGRLDKTVILVTGDHGIRTTLEDPAFRSGFLDEYSFHVPLLLYSTAAFSERTYVDNLTSHIDISPSLADLFGIDEDRKHEQGLPFWSPAVKNRTVAFLANWYLGADGFHRDGTFAMYSDTLGMAFKSDRLHFDEAQLVTSEVETAELRQSVDGLYGLQAAWVQQFLCH